MHTQEIDRGGGPEQFKGVQKKMQATLELLQCCQHRVQTPV